jgi:hypothetical protein
LPLPPELEPLDDPELPPELEPLDDALPLDDPLLDEDVHSP